MGEQEEAFEDYWKDNGVTFGGLVVIELTFKEVAQKAFAAGRKLENEECAKIVDAQGLYLDDSDDADHNLLLVLDTLQAEIRQLRNGRL